MPESVDVLVFFNFRSPYCYLASKSMFAVFDDYHARLVWRPLGGWSGRSEPERAKRKIPGVRQDVARFARCLGIPFTPPPITTDPTKAACGSLLAERRGVLEPYVVEVMRAEWAEGKDIGDLGVLLDVGASVGLDRAELERAATDEPALKALEGNWEAAQEINVFGVPSFVVGDQIFWGNDRIDFLREHLHELRLARR